MEQKSLSEPTSLSGQGDLPVPAYRWVVLAAYMLLSLWIQVQWVALSPVSRAATHFYGAQIAPGAFFNVDFLAMAYLVVFLLASFPASYVVDTFGLRWGLGAGAALAAGAAVAKGLFPDQFAVVVGAQIVLALAQPLVLNSATALGAHWFPLKERGTAVGLASLSQYLGIVVAMVVGPLVVEGNAASASYGQGVTLLTQVYAVGTVVGAALCLAFLRDHPARAVEEGVVRLGFRAGIASLAKNRDFVLLVVLFAIGLGIFNAVSSLVDALTAALGIRDSDGLIGTAMILGGIVGALILPVVSDRLGRRKVLLVACMAGMVPSLGGLALAGSLGLDQGAAFGLALAASALLGFFVMSAGPIGFEYAAEVGRPAPEATSQGILLWVGQLTGIVFMVIMESPDRIQPLLSVFVALAVVALVATFFLRESALLKK
jgi:MFS family permease